MSPKATDVVAAAVPIAVGDPNPTHAPLENGRLRKRFVALPFAPATRSTRPSPLTSPVANELTFGVARAAALNTPGGEAADVRRRQRRARRDLEPEPRILRCRGGDAERERAGD